MIKILSDNQTWEIIINEIEYEFYYSEIGNAMQGLFLNGSTEDKNIFQIENKVIYAIKEYDIYLKDYRYILVIENLETNVEDIKIIDKEKANDLLNSYENNKEYEPLGKFYLIENGCHIGIDNSSGNAFTDEFKSFNDCIKWLKEEVEIDEEGNIIEYDMK